jgi:tungstate transport system ATP-binding protein
MFELRGVRIAYAGREVLNIDELLVERGARLAIVGPNGAGKSTLLRVLAFLERPDQGTISLDGVDVSGDKARRAARRRVTLVEQRPFLFRGTALDNVAFGPRARGLTRREAERGAREALARVAAEPLAGRDVRALSEGERQRVAVARALAATPDALLLDEPVAGADRAAQHALYAAIAAVQAQRAVTVCVASHQLEDAYRWADRVLALHHGRPAPVTPENLFRVELTGLGPLQKVAIGPLAVEVVTERTGPATLAIPPDEVVLSTEPLHSSARNALGGRIVRVAEQGAAIRVTVDGGVELVALITRKSFAELGLGVGKQVYASFKSVAVKVF